MLLLETIKEDWTCRLPDRLKYNRYRGASRGCYQFLCLIYYFFKTVCLLALSVYYYVFYGLYRLLKFFFERDVYYDEDIYDEDDEDLYDYEDDYEVDLNRELDTVFYDKDRSELIQEIKNLQKQIESLNQNINNSKNTLDEVAKSEGKGTVKLSDICKRKFDLKNLKLGDEYFYASLALCVIDAVFSIGVKYSSTRNTVDRYCKRFDLEKFNKDNRVINEKHTLEDLIKNIEEVGIQNSAEDIFQNRQRTSSVGGILKSEAVYLYAQILSKYGINKFENLKIPLPEHIENEIKQIPGQKSGISLKYFYMLAGEDNLIKPDRHILRFIEEYTGKKVDGYEAQKEIERALSELREEYPSLTAKMLDHAIWNYMSNRAQ